MTVMTPAGIVATFTNIAKDLDKQADEIAQLDLDFVTKRANFKRAYARIFLTTEGANDIRRHTADLQTADLSLEVELSEQVLRSAREAQRVLRDRLEIGRSLSAIMRMEWSGTS